MLLMLGIVIIASFAWGSASIELFTWAEADNGHENDGLGLMHFEI